MVILSNVQYSSCSRQYFVCYTVASHCFQIAKVTKAVRLHSCCPTSVRLHSYSICSSQWDQARSHRGAFGGSAPPKLFCAPQKFVSPRKMCFRHIVKAKILSPWKCIVPHQISKPTYGPECDWNPAFTTHALCYYACF